MPLGNSITEGVNGQATYRYYLWHYLIDGGFSVDFVGSMKGAYGDPPRYTDFDPDHEGHYGWRVDQLQSSIGSLARAASPDIVLIHAGSNDLLANKYDVENPVGEVQAIIDSLRACNPVVCILLAKIIPSAAFDVSGYNQRLAQVAAAENYPASPVVSVDCAAGMVLGSDYLTDNLHPNDSGFAKMARAWYAALQPVLRSKAPRAAVTFPAVNGAVIPGAAVVLRAAAVAWPGIATVEFFIDNQKAGEDDQTPFEAVVTAPAAGSHTVRVLARAVTGDTASSGTVTFTAGNLPPRVVIEAPRAGAWTVAPGSVAFRIAGSDSDGTIAKILLCRGSTAIRECPSTPCLHTETGLAAGMHDFAARAVDDRGDSSVPATCRVRVIPASALPFGESSGICVFEAEHATGLDNHGDPAGWKTGTDALASGGIYRYVPEPDASNQSQWASGAWNSSCEMSFDVVIATAGLWYIKARRRAPTVNDDSGYLGVDGNQAGGRAFEGVSTGWTWTGTYALGNLNAGLHTIQVTRREAGLQIDRLAMSWNTNLLPASNAADTGPAESGRYIASSVVGAARPFAPGKIGVRAIRRGPAGLRITLLAPESAGTRFVLTNSQGRMVASARVSRESPGVAHVTFPATKAGRGIWVLSVPGAAVRLAL